VRGAAHSACVKPDTPAFPQSGNCNSDWPVVANDGLCQCSALIHKPDSDQPIWCNSVTHVKLADHPIPYPPTHPLGPIPRAYCFSTAGSVECLKQEALGACALAAAARHLVVADLSQTDNLLAALTGEGGR
jgi:hypothetical protein